MALNELDEEYVRGLVRQRSAIVLDETKGYLIEARLEPLARRSGVPSTTELVRLLRGDRSGGLERQVVDAMTTNETSFFRDVHPWTAFEGRVVPELLAREPQRPLTVWSAACSSGQEPYSVAMLLQDRFGHALADREVRILGTDLSAEMIDRARAGSFSQLEVNRGLPAAMLVRHFTREGSTWRIDPALRRMVEFRTMNLCGPWTAVPQVDVLFLRNVLIYFDVETKRAILRQVREVLRPGGYLFLGAAETTLNIDDSFVRAPLPDVTAYQLR